MNDPIDQPVRPRLVLLMRHARMQRATKPAEVGTDKLWRSDDGSDSSEQALTSIGRALAESFHEKAPGCQADFTRLHIIYEPTKACELTAATVMKAYGHARTTEFTSAPPVKMAKSEIVDSPSAYAPTDGVGNWVDRWTAEFAQSPKPDNPVALLYIGHAPRVVWLLGALQGRGRNLLQKAARWITRRFAPPTPSLLHGEMIAGDMSSGRFAAKWSLAPTDSGSEKAIQAKIKSKMDTAKVFAGVLTAVTAFAADDVRSLDGIDRASALGGLALLGLAVILYLITMFWYDALLMPSRFWGTGPGGDVDDNRLVRPPSSSTWLLMQNMVMVWARVFVPATYAAGLGLVLYLYGAAELPGSEEQALFGIGLAWVVIVSVGLGTWGRPRLGSQD